MMMIRLNYRLCQKPVGLSVITSCFIMVVSSHSNVQIRTSDPADLQTIPRRGLRLAHVKMCLRLPERKMQAEKLTAICNLYRILAEILHHSGCPINGLLA